VEKSRQKVQRRAASVFVSTLAVGGIINRVSATAEVKKEIQLEVNVVSREKQIPHFQTVFATGVK